MDEQIKLTSFEEAWEVYLQRSGSGNVYNDNEVFYAGAYAALGVFANRLAASSTNSIQELSEELSRAIQELKNITED